MDFIIIMEICTLKIIHLCDVINPEMGIILIDHNSQRLSRPGSFVPGHMANDVNQYGNEILYPDDRGGGIWEPRDQQH